MLYFDPESGLHLHYDLVARYGLDVAREEARQYEMAKHDEGFLPRPGWEW